MLHLGCGGRDGFALAGLLRHSPCAADLTCLSLSGPVEAVAAPQLLVLAAMHGRRCLGAGACRALAVELPCWEHVASLLASYLLIRSLLQPAGC